MYLSSFNCLRSRAPLAVLATGILCTTVSGPAAWATPIVAPGYTLTQLATPPAGATAADSVAVAGNNVFVGYGNGHAPTGADGLSSTIAKYTRSGRYVGSTQVLGHNDGLRYNAKMGQIWSLQNEDANPNLVLINPTTLKQSAAYSIPTSHGGGYDDVAFVDEKAFITASAPANNPNTKPALISATIPASGSTLKVTPVLNGNASLPDQISGQTTKLNLQDPDGLTKTPANGVLFTSQDNQQLINVSQPGTSNQSATVLNLKQKVDDINFAPDSASTLLFTNKSTSALYALNGIFKQGLAYISGTAANGSISALNLGSGVSTPLVSNIGAPGGLAFQASSASADVPEPSSLGLFALGLGFLGWFARRQRRG